jgi:hypothetical protein
MSFTSTVRVPVELDSCDLTAVARVSLYTTIRGLHGGSEPADVTWQHVILDGEKHDPIVAEERFGFSLDDYIDVAVELAEEDVDDDGPEWDDPPREYRGDGIDD